MGAFEDIGACAIVNAAGPLTRLGGAPMRPEVIAAMTRAASQSVAMVELQGAASRIIARATGAEAGYVTCGAAAGLTLGAAACIAGLDIRKMEVLPHASGLPNEVIVAREHRSGYDHAIRAAGAKLVEVGMNELWAGAGVRAAEAWEYEAAITGQTAAIAYFARPGAAPPLAEVVGIAHRHGIPVLVDAAAQLPPVANLRRFVDLGADLICFSGGKGLRGPQNSGILAGRRDLIASAALQHLDLDEHFPIWDPPASLIPKDKLPGIPRHGVGRALKVSKEAVVGLLAALDAFTSERCVAEAAKGGELLDTIARELADLPGARIERVAAADPEAIPLLTIGLDAARLGADAFEASRRLKAGEPPIYVGEKGLAQGFLTINPMNLDPEQTTALVRRLREIIGDGQRADSGRRRVGRNTA